jgi:hypothetical protein
MQHRFFCDAERIWSPLRTLIAPRALLSSRDPNKREIRKRSALNLKKSKHQHEFLTKRDKEDTESEKGRTKGTKRTKETKLRWTKGTKKTISTIALCKTVINIPKKPTRSIHW